MRKIHIEMDRDERERMIIVKYLNENNEVIDTRKIDERDYAAYPSIYDEQIYDYKEYLENVVNPNFSYMEYKYSPFYTGGII